MCTSWPLDLIYSAARSGSSSRSNLHFVWLRFDHMQLSIFRSSSHVHPKVAVSGGSSDFLGKGMERAWNGVWNEMGQGLAPLNCRTSRPDSRCALRSKTAVVRLARQHDVTPSQTAESEVHGFTFEPDALGDRLCPGRFSPCEISRRLEKVSCSHTVPTDPNGCNREQISKVQRTPVGFREGMWGLRGRGTAVGPGPSSTPVFFTTS